jgi:DUF4097 and DUF4098 domain-containing protein YvlB
MRRGSVIGPILLIGLGTLFLLNNLGVHVSARFIADAWPFVLIVWGLLRLIEVLVAAFRNRPLQGLSGGEWAVAFLVFFVGTGFSAYHNNFGSFPSRVIGERILGDLGETYDYSYEEKKVQAGKTPRIFIENLRGNARITGVADSTEIKVTGRKTVRALQQVDADKANTESPIEVSVDANNNVTIRTNQERVTSERRVSSELEIAVPKGATIEARGRYGDFEVNDIDGGLQVESDNAGIRAQNIAGNLRVNLRRSDVIRAVNVKGNVELRGRGEEIELENVGGEVTVEGFYTGEMNFRKLAKSFRFESENSNIRFASVPGEVRIARRWGLQTARRSGIHVQSRSKDVQLSDFSDPVEIRLQRGDIELRPARRTLGKMNVRTEEGQVDVFLPEGANFSLRAEVEKGNIENDYGSPLNVDESGRGARATGQVGTGPEVEVSTRRGSITLRKGDVSTPPMPDPAPQPGSVEPPKPPKPPIKIETSTNN